jgi:transcriptional regulator with XRE-family HTH domain
MSEVELGKRNISLKNIEAISKALGISISSLFDFDKTHEKKA